MDRYEWYTEVWYPALRAAAGLQADYPGWQVDVVQRREGLGVLAHRDSDGTCVVVGLPDEVRAALALEQPADRE